MKSWTPEGRINSDIKDEPGVNPVADISKGLPIETDSLNYAVSIHSLPEIPYPDLVPKCGERRDRTSVGSLSRHQRPAGRPVAKFPAGGITPREGSAKDSLMAIIAI